MSNDISTLREHLFDALKGLKDGTVDIDKAKAMSEVAQTIINTAKVEVEYAKATGATGSSFLEMAPIDSPDGDLPPGIVGRTIHRIR